jgi:hypothetical protein
MLPIDDPDVWWRFRSGRRIAEHHAVAVQDFFQAMKWESRGSYSRFFEAMLYGACGYSVFPQWFTL